MTVRARSSTQGRVTIEFRDTRLGTLAVVTDEQADPGVRQTTEAEKAVLSNLTELVEELNVIGGERTSRQADITVKEDGEFEANWRPAPEVQQNPFEQAT